MLLSVTITITIYIYHGLVRLEAGDGERGLLRAHEPVGGMADVISYYNIADYVII